MTKKLFLLCIAINLTLSAIKCDNYYSFVFFGDKFANEYWNQIKEFMSKDNNQQIISSNDEKVNQSVENKHHIISKRGLKKYRDLKRSKTSTLKSTTKTINPTTVKPEQKKLPEVSALVTD